MRGFIIFCFFFAVFAAAETARFALGDAYIYAIKDQDNNMSSAVLLNSETARKFPKAERSSINAFLIAAKNFDGEVILVDTGFGAGLFDGLKRILPKNREVTKIIITHMHRDHIGGLTNGDAPRFDNANVFVPANDLAYWSGSSRENAKDAALLRKAYGDRLKTYKWGEIFEIGGGVKLETFRADGHTPGHTVIEVSSAASGAASGAKKLLIIADLIHFSSAQFPDPKESVRFDVDPAMAAKTRTRLLNYAANNNIPIAGMHLAFPAFGSITRRSGGGFNYAPYKTE
ncbi:MAG: MBL fold metallo-hydrolase [Helicobacteraceae bacterium]|jgi:glyoxylase-like metal-dependent hydrolase (beta-lactamase superfamily II)|nr:MBL fold metallo-hydrolase [Helicobacteraceae bacterium]